MNTRYTHREEGFTLLDLMVGLAIIGILSAISLPIWINFSKIDNDRTVETDSLALSLYAGKAIGAGNTRSISTLEEAGFAYADPEVVLAIKADRHGICVTGWHPKGQAYSSPETAYMVYDGREVDCPDHLIP